jgi:hypothetical protein
MLRRRVAEDTAIAKHLLVVARRRRELYREVKHVGDVDKVDQELLADGGTASRGSPSPVRTKACSHEPALGYGSPTLSRARSPLSTMGGAAAARLPPLPYA